MDAFSVWIEREPADGMIDCLTGDHFPIAFTKKEGGSWRSVGPDRRIAGPVAAVLFEDGRIFDFILIDKGMRAWRRMLPCKPKIRVPALRAACQKS